MTIHIFSLGFGRGVFAVLKRGVDTKKETADETTADATTADVTTETDETTAATVAAIATILVRNPRP